MPNDHEGWVPEPIRDADEETPPRPDPSEWLPPGSKPVEPDEPSPGRADATPETIEPQPPPSAAPQGEVTEASGTGRSRILGRLRRSDQRSDRAESDSGSAVPAWADPSASQSPPATTSDKEADPEAARPAGRGALEARVSAAEAAALEAEQAHQQTVHRHEAEYRELAARLAKSDESRRSSRIGTRPRLRNCAASSRANGGGGGGPLARARAPRREAP